jgi:phosphatidylethanolamine/phosphatidyl-N-methylethanolamine N-methyltransferase
MSDNPAMRWVERRLAPLAGKIGFHADFPLEPFLERGKLDVREVRPSNLFGYWKLLRCLNNKLPNG